MIFPVPDKSALWIIKACAVLALGALLWLHGAHKGAEAWKAKLAAVNAAHKATLDDLAAKTARAARLADEASKAAAIERQANDKRFDDAQAQADKAERDLAAALRAGTERLQPWWSCDRPGSAEGDAATAAGGDDGYADVRSAGAASLIAAADHADRWIGWLQGELTSTRKACGVEP